MSKKISIAILFLLIAGSAVSFAQLQVTPNNNATQLAQTLAGPGVTISGAVLNCPSSANPASNPTGTFVGTASNIGITGGVLLTTGEINQAIGPNSTSGITTSNNTTFNDPNLMAIQQNAIYDVCILEFNAVPTCSTLAFTFAFGSDEYPEFVNSSYNDVFGIFVTGPNPLGPAYTGYNMALLPSTTTAVAINNVNNGTTCPGAGPCTNCAYFIDNCTLGPPSTIEYDGFTKPINVTLNVQPCVSYHFKLAIADAGDHILDSGVFFAMQSLACNPLPVLVGTTSTPSACSANNGSATATPTGGTAPYTYSWNTTPPQLTQTATGLAPGNYTVSVTDATGCFSNTGTVTVGGGGGFTATSVKTDAACFGGVGSATVTPVGGNAPLTYAWSTVPVQTNSVISNIPAGTYSCTITDVTGCVYVEVVTISQPPSMTLTVSNIINASCPFSTDGSATASAGGGATPYNYTWNTTPPQAGATASNLGAGNYMVTAADANGCTTTQTFTITQPPPMTFLSATTMASCGMSDGSATISPSGGAAPYTYLWLTTPAVQTTPTASNLATGTYTVIITDANGCLQNQAIFVPGGAPPVANFIFTPEIVNLQDPTVYFSDASSGVISDYFWNFGDPMSGMNDTSSLQNPSHAFSDTGVYCITLIVTNPSGMCADTVTQCLKVEAPSTFYIPNTFTPNKDGVNDIFLAYGTYISKFEMYIFDRWGNLIFESDDITKGWNGSVNNNGNRCQEDVYVWKVKLTDTNKANYTYVGHVTMVR